MEQDINEVMVAKAKQDQIEGVKILSEILGCYYKSLQGNNLNPELINSLVRDYQAMCVQSGIWMHVNREAKDDPIG